MNVTVNRLVYRVETATDVYRLMELEMPSGAKDSQPVPFKIKAELSRTAHV